MDKKNWAKELFRPENKKARINLFTAFLVGVLLLLMSHIFIEPTQQQQPEKQIEQRNNNIEESSIERELEKRLESVFSNMEGVGQVKDRKSVV